MESVCESCSSQNNAMPRRVLLVVTGLLVGTGGGGKNCCAASGATIARARGWRARCMKPPCTVGCETGTRGQSRAMSVDAETITGAHRKDTPVGKSHGRPRHLVGPESLPVGVPFPNLPASRAEPGRPTNEEHEEYSRCDEEDS